MARDTRIRNNTTDNALANQREWVRRIFGVDPQPVADPTTERPVQATAGTPTTATPTPTEIVAVGDFIPRFTWRNVPDEARLVPAVDHGIMANDIVKAAQKRNDTRNGVKPNQG